MRPLARLILTSCALLLLTAAPARGESATLSQDLPIPDFFTLDATLDTSAGDIDVALDLAYDEKGKVVNDGVCQVDGVDVLVKGKAKLQKKTGEVTFSLKAFNKEVGLTVVLQGPLVAGTQEVEGSYKGPKGKIKLEEGEQSAEVGASATAPQLVIQLDLDEDEPGVTAVGPKGVITGTATLTSPYDNLPAEPAVLKAKVKKTTFSFSVSQGTSKVKFKGAWDGNGYVGKLSYKLPPSKGKVVDVIVPAIVEPDIQLKKSDKVFITIALTGEAAPGTTESYTSFGGLAALAPELHVTPKGEVVYSGAAIALPPVTGLWTGTPGSPMAPMYLSGTTMPTPGGGGVGLSTFTVREFSPAGDVVLQGFYGLFQQGLWHVSKQEGTLRHVASDFSDFIITVQPDTLVRGDVLTAVNDKGDVAFYALEAVGEVGSVWAINAKDKDGRFALNGQGLASGPEQGQPLTLATYVDMNANGMVGFPTTAPSTGLWTGQVSKNGGPYTYDRLAYETESGPILMAPDEGCEEPCVDEAYDWVSVDDQVSLGTAGKDDVLAFKGRYAGPGVNTENDEGLWVRHPAHGTDHPLPVIFEGETFAPETGLPKVGSDFDPLFVTETGDVVFSVHEDELPGEDEPLLLLHYDGTQVSLLARDAEVDRSIVFVYGFGGYPGLLFRSDTGQASDEPVLWSGKRRNAENEFERVIGFGDQWLVEEGDTRTVVDFLTSNVNDAGQFLMVLLFDNGSQALVFVEGNRLSTL